MTLINDSIEDVKTSLIYAIKKELTETYPKEFGDYRSERGDIYTKVYWEDTVRFQPKFPICVLSPSRDVREGYNEISYRKGEDGAMYKRVVKRSFLTVTIDISDMGIEEGQGKKSSLKASSFVHKVARQLRSYFNGDEKLNWFSGNEFYPKQIGITVDDNINIVSDWSDTDTFHRCTFDITLGWDEENIIPIDKAHGAKISVSENTNLLDEFTIEIDKGD